MVNLRSTPIWIALGMMWTLAGAGCGSSDPEAAPLPRQDTAGAKDADMKGATPRGGQKGSNMVSLPQPRKSLATKPAPMPEPMQDSTSGGGAGQTPQQQSFNKAAESLDRYAGEIEQESQSY